MSTSHDQFPHPLLLQVKPSHYLISNIERNIFRKDVACEALNSWLLLSQGMSPSPTWTDNSCRKCTHEVIR